MQLVAILSASTALAWLIDRRKGGWRDHARRGLAAAIIVAGITHFARAEPFVQHLPDWVPAREGLVYLTGAIEIALGVALIRSTRHRATVGRVSRRLPHRRLPRQHLRRRRRRRRRRPTRRCAGLAAAATASAVHRLGARGAPAPAGDTPAWIHRPSVTQDEKQSGVMSSTAGCHPASRGHHREAQSPPGGSMLRAIHNRREPNPPAARLLGLDHRRHPQRPRRVSTSTPAPGSTTAKVPCSAASSPPCSTSPSAPPC